MSDQDVYVNNKEQRILSAMRKTLSSIVRDVTPNNSSLKSPLSQSTTDDIIMCFGLITAREKEILEHNKQHNNLKPHFTDEVKSSHNISLESLRDTLKNKN